jgi:uncharacterized protein YndB with AHSA1/START domain
MTVRDVTKDLEALTMTITAAYDAPVERVWQVLADPRQLERWWGPPTFPATVVDHDLTPGGRMTYYMTGPEGERHHGYWAVDAVEAPRMLEVEDGFADASFAPDPGMPTTRARFTLTATAGGGTLLEVRSTFPSRDAMAQLVAMGMEEGIRQAVGQIDGILAEGPPA